MGEYAAVIVAVAAVASAAVTTYAAVQASQQQADIQSSIKKQKELDAEAARDSAAFMERQERRRLGLLLGKQQAISAASGVDISVGSPLLQEIDFVQQAELEALNVRRGGALAAGERTFESRIARFQGETARRAIPLQIASGAFSAASSGALAYSRATGKVGQSNLRGWMYEY